MSKYNSYFQQELQPHLIGAKKRAAAYHMLKQAVRDRIDNDMIPLANLAVDSSQDLKPVGEKKEVGDLLGLPVAIPDGKGDKLEMPSSSSSSSGVPPVDTITPATALAYEKDVARKVSLNPATYGLLTSAAGKLYMGSIKQQKRMELIISDSELKIRNIDNNVSVNFKEIEDLITNPNETPTANQKVIVGDLMGSYRGGKGRYDVSQSPARKKKLAKRNKKAIPDVADKGKGKEIDNIPSDSELVSAGLGGSIVLVKNIEQVAKKLNMNLKAKQAGNDSRKLHNESVEMIQFLRESGHITKAYAQKLNALLMK